MCDREQIIQEHINKISSVVHGTEIREDGSETGLDEVGGDVSSTAQSSMHVQQPSQDPHVLQVRFHLFHLLHCLQHRLEAPDPRLLGLLERQRRTELVGDLHRLRVAHNANYGNAVRICEAEIK